MACTFFAVTHDVIMCTLRLSKYYHRSRLFGILFESYNILARMDRVRLTRPVASLLETNLTAMDALTGLARLHTVVHPRFMYLKNIME